MPPRDPSTPAAARRRMLDAYYTWLALHDRSTTDHTIGDGRTYFPVYGGPRDPNSYPTPPQPRQPRRRISGRKGTY